jgi:homoserine kinase type II
MAVYTEVADDALASFIAEYGLGAVLSCKGIAEGVENTNYMVDTEGGRYFLTLFEKRTSPADLPFFLGLMEHLADRGITCPLPVHTKDGRVLGTLAGRPAVLITFLKGVWHRRPQTIHCYGVGRALAGMHLAAADFKLTRKNGLGLANWRPLFDRFAASADEIAPDLKATISRELDTLAAKWPRGLPEGVIHADLFADNVFFLGDTLSGLIDFYFACNDALAYDVAICINAWAFDETHRFDPERCKALLDGYRSVRPLSGAEISALPLLARGSALRFLLTRAFDWINTPAGALVQRKDPGEYLAKLRFHQSVSDAKIYGA